MLIFQHIDMVYAYQSDVLPHYYTITFNGIPLERNSKGGTPYIRIDKPKEEPDPNKILVPLKGIRAQFHLEKFNEKNQTFCFKYLKPANINNKSVTLLYKFIWNLKTNKVYVCISWAPWPAEKNWRILKECTYFIPYGYYGYGLYNTGIKQIWVPIVPLAKILWGDKHYMKKNNMQLPTCLFFPKNNMLMIFTDELFY